MQCSEIAAMWFLIFLRNRSSVAWTGAGSWGAVIALTSPSFGRLFDQAEYAAAFRIATLFPIAGYLLWVVLSSRVRVGRVADLPHVIVQ
jgi:hypothetical protein